MSGPTPRHRAAMTALQQGQLVQAHRMAAALFDEDRKDAYAIELLGQITFGLGMYDEAVTWVRRLIELIPKDTRPYIVLGEIRTHQGRHRDALGAYDKAARLDPTNLRAIAGKADVHEKKGDRKKALRTLDPFIKKGEMTPEMVVILARLHVHEKAYDDAISLIQHTLSIPDIGPFTRWHLGFLLGKSLERIDRHDDAFAAYLNANAAVPASFDLDSFHKENALLKKTFSRERLSALAKASVPTDRPVFVVGMPRSGSTLVESILDAHPDVFGADEFGVIARLIRRIDLDLDLGKLFPACLDDLDAAGMDSLASWGLDRLQEINRKAPRVVDKYLGHFRFLGFIELVYPEATIIHCRRDPLDTCTSAFMEPLPITAHPYTADLSTLGTVYRGYEDLMSHWRGTLSIPVLDVHYEEVVADLEGQARRIIEAARIPWDDRCLRYYESTRVIRTASYDQANKPIYTSSVSRAERFGHHLDPLRQALAGDV